MSTADNTIKLMRYDGLLIIGDYEQGVLLEGRPGRLLRPRIVGMNQQQKAVFIPIIGQPDWVPVISNALVWDITDEEMLANYREAVTGLVIARKQNITPLTIVGGKA